MLKKLLEPSIVLKLNWVGFVGIVGSSLYGCYYLIINSIADIKELIKLFN